MWEIIGLISVLILMPTAWLQALANWKNKSTKGVSKLMIVCLFLGMAGAFAASLFTQNSFFTRLNFGAGALGSLINLIQIVYYGKKGKGGLI